MIDWFVERMDSFHDQTAFVWHDAKYSYGQFCESVRQWSDRLDSLGVTSGQVIAVQGNTSPSCCALIVALALRRGIVVPLASVTEALIPDYLATAGARAVVVLADDGGYSYRECAAQPTHELVEELRRRDHAGLILFSSGSSGKSKACLLDFDRLFDKVRKPRAAFVTLVFLLLDHIGGINTLINVLGQGGTVVTIDDRSAEAVCGAIERWRVQLLPTSPTFLKMLLIADAHQRFDLSSLSLITYGTEVMPLATLTALHQALPGARLKQTYGLSEVGILPTRSRADDSLWLKLGDEGFEHKIVDGILWLRTPGAMLGYLNAPSPFDAEGWFNTQDKVEVDGDSIRILGRDSEMINVGGSKVHPVEIENVILQAANIRDVTVSGRANPVTGSVVVATVALREPEPVDVLRQRLGRFCRERLEPFKVPALFKIATEALHSSRFKKKRAQIEA